MDAVLKRKELIHWLQTVDDPNLLREIEKIKTQSKDLSDTKIVVKKVYSLDEARKLSLSKIAKWPEK